MPEPSSDRQIRSRYFGHRTPSNRAFRREILMREIAMSECASSHALACLEKKWQKREGSGEAQLEDGEIKGARRSNRKPLTWLGFGRAGRSGRVPRLAFSTMQSKTFSACRRFRSLGALAMTAGDSELRIRPGRIRSTRAPKPKSFINQVIRAAKKAGHTSGQAGVGKRSSAYGRSTFGRGRLSFSRSRLFSPARRVVVKARVVRQKGEPPLSTTDGPSLVPEARWRHPKWRASRDVRCRR